MAYGVLPVYTGFRTCVTHAPFISPPTPFVHVHSTVVDTLVYVIDIRYHVTFPFVYSMILRI